jgi:hypothetical protein
MGLTAAGTGLLCKVFFVRYLFILTFVLLITSCNNEPVDSAYIKSALWSYDGGFKIGKGDFLLFDDKEKLFDLKADTIYCEGKPRAIIKDVDKKRFTMQVQSIDGKETGRYRNTEESLR